MSRLLKHNSVDARTIAQRLLMLDIETPTPAEDGDFLSYDSTAESLIWVPAPIGEPGPAGPPGADGVDGADGADGTDGTVFTPIETNTLLLTLEAGELAGDVKYQDSDTTTIEDDENGLKVNVKPESLISYWDMNSISYPLAFATTRTVRVPASGFFPRGYFHVDVFADIFTLFNFTQVRHTTAPTITVTTPAGFSLKIASGATHADPGTGNHAFINTALNGHFILPMDHPDENDRYLNIIFNLGVQDSDNIANRTGVSGWYHIHQLNNANYLTTIQYTST